MNTSTPIKRIRFRADSTFQDDHEPLLDNDHDEYKNGEIPKRKKILKYLFIK
jgi:hypothetical protein